MALPVMPRCSAAGCMHTVYPGSSGSPYLWRYHLPMVADCHLCIHIPKMGYGYQTGPWFKPWCGGVGALAQDEPWHPFRAQLIMKPTPVVYKCQSMDETKGGMLHAWHHPESALANMLAHSDHAMPRVSLSPSIHQHCNA